MSDPGFELRLELPFEAAIERVQQALAAEGFGVLTRIDLHRAFAEKIGADFRPYAILGACNPQLAHTALGVRADIGLLLPCNVTVEQAPEGGSLVRLVDPMAMLASGDLGESEALRGVGADAAARFRRVAAALAG